MIFFIMDVVFVEVDKLVEKVEKMENEISKCYIMLGDREKKMLFFLFIYDLLFFGKQRDKEVQLEKNKNEKMLIEFYEYLKKVIK